MLAWQVLCHVAGRWCELWSLCSVAGILARQVVWCAVGSWCVVVAEVLSPCAPTTVPLSDRHLKSPLMITSVSCFDSEYVPLEGLLPEFSCDFSPVWAGLPAPSAIVECSKTPSYALLPMR